MDSHVTVVGDALTPKGMIGRIEGGAELGA